MVLIVVNKMTVLKIILPFMMVIVIEIGIILYMYVCHNIFIYNQEL